MRNKEAQLSLWAEFSVVPHATCNSIGNLSLPRLVASAIKIDIRPEIDVSPQAEKEYTTFFR